MSYFNVFKKLLQRNSARKVFCKLSKHHNDDSTWYSTNIYLNFNQFSAPHLVASICESMPNTVYVSSLIDNTKLQDIILHYACLKINERKKLNKNSQLILNR